MSLRSSISANINEVHYSRVRLDIQINHHSFLSFFDLSQWNHKFTIIRRHRHSSNTSIMLNQDGKVSFFFSRIKIVNQCIAAMLYTRRRESRTTIVWPQTARIVSENNLSLLTIAAQWPRRSVDSRSDRSTFYESYEPIRRVLNHSLCIEKRMCKTNACDDHSISSSSSSILSQDEDEVNVLSFFSFTLLDQFPAFLSHT